MLKVDPNQHKTRQQNRRQFRNQTGHHSRHQPPYQSQLARHRLPRYALWVVLVPAAIVAAAAATLIGFNVMLWAVLTAVLFVIGAWLITLMVEGKRHASNRMIRYVVYGAFILALIPLLSVIWTVLERGLPGITSNFLWTSMSGVTGAIDNRTVAEGTPVLGGAYHAIVGTLQISLMAAVISVPIGLMSAIYLVEYGGRGPLSRAITFFVDVMTGIPSIVAGLFAAALFGMLFGPSTRTGFVAAVALSVLMIPVVVRSTEEMLRIVPNELREASYALGVRKWRTITKVVIPTAISGIASGVTLAIARVVGETAPILVTAGFATSINWNVFSGWMASLPTFIYYQIRTPTSPTNVEPSDQRAWAAALILILFVMLLNLAARLIARFFAPKTGR